MKIITKPDDTASPASPLDLLAAQADTAGAPLPDQQGDNGEPSQQEMEAAAAATMAKLEAGVSKVMLALLKAGRAWACKKLPELREEWTDDLLQDPADAAVPLLKKHLSFLMSAIGQSPEAAALAISVLPLVMGYVNAIDKHEAAEKAGKVTAAPPPRQVTAARPAPASDVVLHVG
ncbi:hypothetical protein [Polaromonas sp.]|uniref:hypothetical protein n=1 Tax=Polaromonas sp. TaxID=1869339 RepID=UPI003C8EEB3F